MRIVDLIHPFNDKRALFFTLPILAVTSLSAWCALTARSRYETNAVTFRDLPVSAFAQDADLEERLMRWQDRLLEAAPGVLLVMGLLGTFVGLGLAIQEAAGVLSRNTEDAHELASRVRTLSGILRDMGLKFKSSILGIAGHLSVRFLAGTMAVPWRRTIVRHIRERALDAAAAGVQSRFDRVVAALEATRDQVALLGKFDALPEALSGSTEKLVEASRALATSHERFGQTLGAVAREHTDRLQGGLEGIAKRHAATLEEHVRRTEVEAVKATREILVSMLHAVRAMLSEVGVESRELRQAMGASAGFRGHLARIEQAVQALQGGDRTGGGAATLADLRALLAQLHADLVAVQIAATVVRPPSPGPEP